MKIKTVEVEAKKAEAEEIETVVGKEKAIVDIENAKAEIEMKKCGEISTRVTDIQNSARAELDLAIPLVEETKADLQNLDEKAFTEMKAFAKPPAPVEMVLFCVMWLLCNVSPNVEKDKKGPVLAWNSAKKMINNPKGFKAELLD